MLLSGSLDITAHYKRNGIHWNLSKVDAVFIYQNKPKGRSQHEGCSASGFSLNLQLS
ncbi:hypothetical protein ACQCVP_18870 [Rossellomorea vietnamensis]|uniref:hypothetical protein n=1 Tax=Rossellomorea vietnamensis TaxID=218284 RepID=UPI003CF2279F